MGVEAKKLPEDCEAEAAPVHERGELLRSFPVFYCDGKSRYVKRLRLG